MLALADSNLFKYTPANQLVFPLLNVYSCTSGSHRLFEVSSENFDWWCQLGTGWHLNLLWLYRHYRSHRVPGWRVCKACCSQFGIRPSRKRNQVCQAPCRLRAGYCQVWEEHRICCCSHLAVSSPWFLPFWNLIVYVPRLLYLPCKTDWLAVKFCNSVIHFLFKYILV